MVVEEREPEPEPERERVAVLAHPDLDLVAEGPEPTSQDDRSVEFKQFRVQTAPAFGAPFFLLSGFLLSWAAQLHQFLPQELPPPPIEQSVALCLRPVSLSQ